MPAKYQPLVYLPTLPPPCEYGEAIALAKCLPDPRARNGLVRGHLRLALKTATDFAKAWKEDLENCFSIAEYALFEAVDKIDVNQGKDIYAFIQQRIEWRLLDYIKADRQHDGTKHHPKTINLRHDAWSRDPWERLWESDDDAPHRRQVPGDRPISEQLTRLFRPDPAEQTLRDIMELCDDREARMVAELINHDGKVAPVARAMKTTPYMINRWRADLERRFNGTPRQQSGRILKLIFPKPGRRAV